MPNPRVQATRQPERLRTPDHEEAVVAGGSRDSSTPRCSARNDQAPFVIPSEVGKSPMPKRCVVIFRDFEPFARSPNSGGQRNRYAVKGFLS